MAGLMIIPAVFSFSGGDPDTLQAGPALMFITIPKVFESMGLGTVVGILFFTLVLFAAVTSSIALTESAVSKMCIRDRLKGMKAEDAIARMEGTTCGPRPTSCPDQIAQNLKRALAEL